MTLTLGIDISRWQKRATRFPWAKIRAEGARFAYIKATHGRGRDPAFAEFWKQAREEGFIRGAYNWFLPDNAIMEQVDATLEVVQPERDDLPITFDVEEPGTKLRGQELVAVIEAALIYAKEAAGKRPVQYTGSWWYQSYVGNVDSDVLASFPLWIAAYPNLGLKPDDLAKALEVIAKTPPPKLPTIWTSRGVNEVLWQIDGDGGLFAGDVDCDFNVFRGSEEELLAFAAETIPRVRNRLETEVPQETITVDQFLGTLVAPESVGALVAARADNDEMIEKANSFLSKIASMRQTLREAA